MLGPRKTRFSVVAALSVMLVSAACGGSDDSSDDRPLVAEAAGADQASAEVEDRWSTYWQARIDSENTGELDRGTFARTATGKALETQTRRLRNYGRHGLVRVGAPEFRDVEVRRMDGSAMVLACVNADEWTARVDGEPWSAQKYGWELTGSVMKQVEGAWLVVDEMATRDIADMGKTC
ncbi:hypothetical protein [Aeromicrobium sp.]|uniref:hypothetical protein n=1 Tax=Aeromicrobium sp. TaxID=1871063 RepID=UPI0028AEAA6E|nr:hypothetical protein [Aeromicrobium sp.]